MIKGFDDEDIINILQRICIETQDNRDIAMKLYKHMENAMMNNKGDLIILSQMADKYLEQATRQTEILVRLSTVMQRLKQTGKAQRKNATSDLNEILNELDLKGISPFIKKEKGKIVVTEKIEKINKTEDDIDIEMDIDE